MVMERSLRNSESIVVKQGGHSHNASLMDVDNDRDLDLIVTNDDGPNFLLH